PHRAQEIAREVTLDHWLTWQIRHGAADPADGMGLACVYAGGEPFPVAGRPATSIQEDFRKVSASVRSRLLNMSYLEPARYRELCADGALPLSGPDRLLLSQATEAAVQGYRDLITGSADP